ncbi:MAG: T9SS type A sorting domain-containing protein [Candidatus Marinimicrobia bacterium]|nr:T9SS type A sorting domain-containing protein [Candidatus Neomarinimicrobiota bacterium]
MINAKSWLIVLTLGTFILAQGSNNNYPRIEINPSRVVAIVGDTVHFEVVYKESTGPGVDTTATWSVTPDSIGSIDTNAIFTALLPGECLLTAVLDTLEASITVWVFLEEDDEETDPIDQLVILPSDTIVAVGSEVQFAAYYADSLGILQDTVVTWGLSGMPIGQISTEGLLSTNSIGFAIVTAEVGDLRSCSFVIVSDTTTDSSGVNQILITRDSPNPTGYSVMDTVLEGGFWKIGGLPYPMNVLNGGLVYFPVGSITEDIRIHVSLPGFATPGPNGVNFDVPGVVAGVDFQVMVSDSVIEPYYFETPLITGLIFKRGLLNNLGIDPAMLALYFAMEVGDSIVFDSTGIGATMVDSVSNRIFSTVVHFSTLVVKGETVTTSTDNQMIALDYQLLPNFPNPFNPITTLRYSLPVRSMVNLTVYDLLGREVKSLISGTEEAGLQSVIWDATNNIGKPVSAGIYLYQIRVGEFSETGKMILLK